MSVPDDVQTFLRERVETFEQLESLLLLFRERHGWSAEDVAARAKMPLSEIEHALSELSDIGLIEKCAEGGRVRYRLPETSSATEAILASLQKAYAEDTLEVMRLMSKNSMERLRTAAVRTFADAFVLGRKKDG